jgi:hypothetical protein
MNSARKIRRSSGDHDCGDPELDAREPLAVAAEQIGELEPGGNASALLGGGLAHRGSKVG